jgi:DNA-binding HxlR family transcriptional regulator
VKRVSLSKAECPVARSLDVIGDWWTLLIVRDALDGVRRFGAFQKNLGIAKGMLAARLKEMVERGVMNVTPASDGTAYQEYVLTEKGRDLFAVVVALRQWGEEHLYAPGEAHSTLIVSATRQPVGRLELRARNGRPLRSDDTEVSKVEALAASGEATHVVVPHKRLAVKDRARLPVRMKKMR